MERGIRPSGAVRPGAITALLAELVRPPADGSAWSRALRAGAVIGRFELVKELGRGGFGAVWEAKDHELGRAVAFKALLVGGPAVRDERVVGEAEVAARLSHPNIVTLFDVGRADEGLYLVLELLRGETLARRLEQGPIPAREAVRVAVEVAKGLAHAHGAGVVHRDLTPGNVFLCDDGQVKVLDLGMAHAFGRRKLDGGTRDYMAPEQAEGAPEDERTDVFALGVVLYLMLTGELPYPRERRARWRMPPELEAPGAPALGALVHRMLAVRPTERPRDAGEVLTELSVFQRELERCGASVRTVRRRHRLARLAAVALLGVAIGIAATVAPTVWQARHGAVEAPPSIAVLPFTDLSPQHDQEYFADGVAEELLNALAQVDGLRVPARTSSFYFKGKGAVLGEIGRELKVTHVLQGSLRKAGPRVRVAAQIVDVADGSNLWAQTFDGDLADMFAVQDQVTRAVVSALRLKVLPSRAHAEAQRVSPEAYGHYLLGRQMFYTSSDEDLARAVKHLERAVALEPGFAPAWAFLANSIVQRAVFTGSATAEDLRRASEAVEKAIAIAPDDAIGYVSRTYLRQALLWDWPGAQADVERAIALGKGSLRPENQHALLLGTLGRTREAIAAARKATEHDPLNGVYWANLGYLYIDAGELGPARAAVNRALEITPERHRYGLGLVELLAGDPAAALAEFQRHPREVWRLNGIAMAKHDLGAAAESQEALDLLLARYGAREPFAVAEVHARRGERDQAFEWLERAYRQRDLAVPSVKSDPLFRELHGDPRYVELLRRLNLPLD